MDGVGVVVEDACLLKFAFGVEQSISQFVFEWLGDVVGWKVEKQLYSELDVWELILQEFSFILGTEDVLQRVASQRLNTVSQQIKTAHRLIIHTLHRQKGSLCCKKCYNMVSFTPSFMTQSNNTFISTIMLAEVARDYLQRFSNLMTESVYASKGLEDYSRMKRYADYLDYDKQTLFREKGKAEAGLRNIGNTCYLNVILQLLFHVNYLREKVFTSQVKSELVKLVRSLFGEMAIGRLAFADPTDLFEHLKTANPDVFVAGVQNDFHQIFTLLIDRLSEGYREASPEEARFISKLLFGKMATRIDFGEGKTTKMATFNIINLEVAEGCFEKAFEQWRSYRIEGYETAKGCKVTASAQNIFVETPALMTFFINRVSYRQKKLQKDTRVFEFEKSILISKCQHSDRTKMTKNSGVQQKEKALLQEKAELMEWLLKIEGQRIHLLETLKYLKAKQTPLLSEPHKVENSLGETALSSTAAYLKKQLSGIEVKVQQVRKEVGSIEQRLKRLQEQGNYETYFLWAVMIHVGGSAVHGHYKVCISINDHWVEYNDRIVKPIPPSRIQQYKARGQICCLFYRRPTLLCDNQRIPVPLALKNMVGAAQRQSRQQIDKARLLQLLYQETESANILLQHQIHYGINQKFQFFFKPVHFALSERLGPEASRGILISETIRSEPFRNALTSRLISENAEVGFQRMRFGIPEQYFAVQQNLKTFFSKEAFLPQVQAAYEELAGKRLKFTSRAVKERYYEILQIIVLKGLYYLKVIPMELAAFSRMSSAIDKILEAMDQSSEFALVTIAIKSSILPQVPTQTRRQRSIIKAVTIDNFGEYFTQNFRFWIKQHDDLPKLDESNFTKGAPVLPIRHE